MSQDLRNDRHLSVHDLRRRITEGDIDTVVVAFTDMQGRLQGKRMHARVLRRARARPRHRGLQLPAVGRRRHEHRRRLRDVVVGAAATATWSSPSTCDTIRLLPHLPGTAMVQCDLVWLDHTPVAAVAADDPEDPARPGRRSRATSRWPAPSWSSSPSTPRYEEAWTLAATATWSRPTSTTSTTRSSAPAGSSRCCARSATPCTPPGMDVESAKGECNFGQHEIGFLYADALTTADNHAVYKTAAKEIAAQHGQVADLHGQVQRARGQLLPHPPVAARRRRLDWSSGTTAGADAAVRPLHRRAAGHDGATSPCCTRRTSTPTSGSPPARSRRPRSPGALDNRTCAVRLVGPRPERPAGEPGARRRRQPLPGARRHARRRAARHRARAGARARADRQRLHVRPADRAADAAGGPGRVPRLDGRPGAASATRSSTTTPTWPTSSWPPSTPRSPTGSCAAASRGCEHDRR